MERAQLEAFLADGLSLEQIGALVDRDPSTVGYWLRKHGLKAIHSERHAARGGIPREVLEDLVAEGLTLRQIGDRVDRSAGAVRHWLGRYALKTNRRRGRQPIVPREVVDRAIAGGLRTIEADCPNHGHGVFIIENSGRARCRRCRMERVSARRRKVKRILLEEAGGRCSRCGYDACVGALGFHHRDPADKAFGIAVGGRTLAIDKMRAEAKKCVLLCANCHAEVEAGLVEAP